MLNVGIDIMREYKLEQRREISSSVGMRSREGMARKTRERKREGERERERER